MTFGVYSIKDKETGFMSPVFDVSDGAAKRGFARAVNQSDGIIPWSPADFDLYKIGEFDNQTGLLIPLPVVQFICNGLSLVGAKE